MQQKWRTVLVVTLLLPLLGRAALSQSTAELPSPVSGHPGYSRGTASADGTGKYYMGREIAYVMGHRGAEWLERRERDLEEKPKRLLKALEVEKGAIVADVGAGTGYFTWRLAREVGDQGLVYAIDIQPEMLELLEKSMAKRKVGNYRKVLGTATGTGLPERSIDLALMVDVYHEFSHPYEMLRDLCRALKPGGWLIFVEYRGEDASLPVKPLHKMTEEQIRREASIHPLQWTKTISALPRQHVVVFQRRDE